MNYMTGRKEYKFRREGLETAGVQRGVGSNPTPRTKINPTHYAFSKFYGR